MIQTRTDFPMKMELSKKLSKRIMSSSKLLVWNQRSSFNN